MVIRWEYLKELEKDSLSINTQDPECIYILAQTFIRCMNLSNCIHALFHKHSQHPLWGTAEELTVHWGGRKSVITGWDAAVTGECRAAGAPRSTSCQPRVDWQVAEGGGEESTRWKVLGCGREQWVKKDLLPNWEEYHGLKGPQEKRKRVDPLHKGVVRIYWCSKETGTCWSKLEADQGMASEVVASEPASD